MRALIVQHEHDGPAGLIGEHLQRRGYEMVVHQVMPADSTHSDAPFPDPEQFDLIVPLGSVRGVYEHDLIGSWIHREVEMLRTAHDADVPLFGICFGAQSITAALGGHVEKAPRHEIGWYHYDSDVPNAIAAGPWFTWHGDRCVLPADVAELARNEMCSQAFRAGRTVGVQFHPEVTRELVAGWADKCSPEYFADHGSSIEHVVGGFDEFGEVAKTQATTLFDWYLDEIVR